MRPPINGRGTPSSPSDGPPCLSLLPAVDAISLPLQNRRLQLSPTQLAAVGTHNHRRRHPVGRTPPSRRRPVAPPLRRRPVGRRPTVVLPPRRPSPHSPAGLPRRAAVPSSHRCAGARRPTSERSRSGSTVSTSGPLILPPPRPTTSAPATPPCLGVVSLSDIRFVRRLGAGDIGSVYLAEVKGKGGGGSALVVTKVMDRKELAGRNKEGRARTEREILEAVDHPFLPRLYGVAEGDHWSCLLTEFCPGGDLHVLHQRQPHRRFSESTVTTGFILLAL
ncbi:hypothetical protein E2562_011491 [Oryza meyeriana var. granulata]|uniref:non-specific serine/threonine protein kinase n=1 Tax=Oryza meyeriana var. granulata TaxID=110450 RepID=A0A6G1D257_9ORYZ|nr:hypothetical protein E2562_011491 [Oryza meyeriana var. granulata]